MAVISVVLKKEVYYVKSSLGIVIMHKIDDNAKHAKAANERRVAIAKVLFTSQAIQDFGHGAKVVFFLLVYSL